MVAAQCRDYHVHEGEIEWAIEVVARRWRLQFDQTEDFAQDVRMYFLEHYNCPREPGAHPAYFLRIVTRRAIDWQRRIAGRRLAPSKTRMTVAPSEAVETVHTSRDALRTLADRRASMLARRFAVRMPVPWDKEKCESVADPTASASPLTLAMQHDAAGCAGRIATGLERALALLDARERRLVVEYFAGPLTFGRRRSRCGRHLRRVLDELRQMLASAGVNASLAKHAVESGALECYVLIGPAEDSKTG
jgi:DNA-directed RNA polymerase specialized sigma24 family protein